MSVNWVLVGQVIFALGGLSGLSSIITLLITRRKWSAEARKLNIDVDDVGQNINDKRMANLFNDNEVLRKEIKDNRAELSEAKKRASEYYDEISNLQWGRSSDRRVIIELVDWVREAWVELQRLGSHMRKPPLPKQALPGDDSDKSEEN